MFKQLFDEVSSTLTYLIVDDESKEAILIDPVISHLDEYIAVIEANNYKLKYSLETHVHADHITASGLLRERLNALTAVSELCGAKKADIQLNDGDFLLLGNQKLSVLATPGHTAGSLSFLWKDRLFSGDALLINGCGRTDFQGGDAATLYNSIQSKIFSLPDETLVYPGHDYNRRRVTSVAQEKLSNSRLAGKSLEEFVLIMNSLNLPKPSLIDIAVPANRICGVPEERLVQG
jgi:sulfur dioxygenase